MKKVWASLFSPEALVYRRQMDMLQEEAAMAALVQEIVSSRASGVIHSLDLSVHNSDCLVIYAHLGLGRTVVEGKTPLDTFVVERRRPFHLKSADIAVKTSFRRPAAGGGEEEVVVTGAEQSRPSLAEEQITNPGFLVPAPGTLF